jgi:hypothetical protein
MINRIDALTLLASAFLSTFAYVAANDKTPVQHIDFKEPIVISVPTETIVVDTPLVITAKRKN